MAAYGLGRTTFDVDLVMPAAAQDEMIAALEGRGYKTLHRSSGLSNHRHGDSRWGSVDLGWVRGDTAATMFASVRQLPGPGARPWPVVSPEHLAAMKVHALSQDPGRWEDWGDRATCSLWKAWTASASGGSSPASAGSNDMKNCSPGGDGLDLERDLPVSREEAKALRRLRLVPRPTLLRHVHLLAWPAWLPPPARRRTTHRAFSEFTLE